MTRPTTGISAAAWIALSVCLVAPSIAWAQTPNGHYDRAMIFVEDGSVYTVESLSIAGERLTFRNTSDPSVSELRMDQVTRVRKESIHRDWSKVAYFSGIAGGTAIGGVLANDQVGNKGAIVAGFFIGGALIGYAIAGNVSTWSDVYVRDPNSGSTRPLRFSILPQPRGLRVGVSLPVR